MIYDLVDEEIITSSMFNTEQFSLFRKTLALIEDNDYNLPHFQFLLNSLLDDKELKSKRTLIKQLRLVNLLLIMLTPSYVMFNKNFEIIHTYFGQLPSSALEYYL